MKIPTLPGTWVELAENALLALFGFALVYYLLYVHPVGYIYFITEDYWAEWATCVSFAMASCLLAWTLCKDKGTRKLGFILLALGAFFIAGEEISWGQRILGFLPPDFFAVHNLKKETNLHNLVKTNEPYRYPFVGLAVFLWSILLPLLTRKSTRLRRWCHRLGIPIVSIHLWPFFLLAIYFLMDSSLKKSEVAELYLGIAVCALSLDLALTTRRGTQARGVTGAIATAGMIVSIGILTAALVQFYPRPIKLRYNLGLFASVSYPKAGMPRQAAMLRDYMKRNPQFLAGVSYFQEGVMLMRMGHHAQATEVLELALAEQQGLQRRHPDDPEPYRMAGQALTLLDRPKEAEQVFLDAIAKDRARLDRASDAATKPWIHFSLGATLLAMGNPAAASIEFSRARSLAPDQESRKKMDRVMKRWAEKNVVAE